MPPLVYYWKVEYKDGKDLSQFDANGIEHKWGEVSLSQIKVFSWLPFSKELVQKINSNYADMAKASELKGVSLELGPGEDIRAFRRNFITNKGMRWTLYCFGTNLRTLQALTEKGELLEEVA